MKRKRGKVSLGKRLRACPSFRCFGIKPNWEDYPIEAREAIMAADTVYYPGALYEGLFKSLGKKTYPTNYYRFVGNKIRQTNLFQLLDIPHPRTRVYYGGNRFRRIREDFDYPFVAKVPVGSSKGTGVHLIEDDDELGRYLDGRRPAYIQEYLPSDWDLRAVLIKGRVIHAYRRLSRAGEFRNNVSQGADISFDDIPEEGLELARRTALLCGFEEVGLDILPYRDRYYVLEANMVYGLEGFVRAGLDLGAVFAGLDREGFL